MKLLLILLSLTILNPSLAEAAPNFMHTPEGEVASDHISDLSENPEFVWSMDPFLKLPGYSNFSDPQEMKLEVQATMPDGEIPMAVVNDEVVHVGDKIGRKTVFRIGKDFVLLKENESIVEATIADNDSQSNDKPVVQHLSQPVQTPNRMPASSASSASSSPTSSDSDAGIETFFDPKIDINEVIQ